MLTKLLFVSIALSSLALGAEAQTPADAAAAADPNRTALGTARADFRETLHAKADAGLPAYSPAAEVAGTLTVMGTDTMADLMKIWIVGFSRRHSKIAFHLEAKGSLTGA